MSVNIYVLFLDLIRLSFPSDGLRRVLESLDDAMAACDRAITNARKIGDQGYVEAVVDDESEIAEALTGTAFVVAQTEISGTVSYVKRLRERFQANHPGRQLTTTTGRKADIMAFGGSAVAGNYTSVETINAFANYFKHSDEWDSQWRASRQQEQETIDILRAAGANPGSTGNLRTGAALLDADMCGLIVFSSIVEKWKQSVEAAYRSELTSRGLI